jgi:hypothetical protein
MRTREQRRDKSLEDLEKKKRAAADTWDCEVANRMD